MLGVMHKKSLFQFGAVVALTAALVIAMTAAVGSVNDSIAKKYEKSQATTQASNCGNGQNNERGTVLPAAGSTSCQNIDSHVQGDDNSVSLAGVQNGVP